MLSTLLCPAAKLISETSHRPEPGKIWRARCFIQEHLEEQLSLPTVAESVGLSPNYLSEKFKEITGENFVDYIAQRRFLKACQLLHDRELKVSEIAFQVGFQSLSQFNRVFKKLSGQTPSRYRASICATNGRSARQPFPTQ